MPPLGPPRPPFGTAPHMLLPGVWVTLGGRPLTAAGNRYWTQQYQLRAVDRFGHYDPQRGQLIKQARSAPTHAARIAAGQTIAHQDAAAQEKFRTANGAGIISSLNPLNPGPAMGQIASGIKHRNPVAVGLGAMAILPGGKLIKPVREGVNAVRDVGLAERAAPEAKVLASLDSAKRGHAIKAALQSEERARRFARSEEAFKAAGGGQLGHAAAKAELKGALPTVHFSALGDMTNDQLDYLTNVVHAIPDFLPGEKTSLSEALKNAKAGVNPRPYEIKLMERAFGPDVAEEFGNQSISGWRHALDLINIPRALMTAYDLSGGLRQNLVALIHKPGIVGPELVRSAKYLWSKDAYNARMAELEADPMFHIYESQGGRLTDLGKNVANREEYYPSKAAEKIPGIKGSGRAFTGLSNSARFLIWKDMYQGALTSGAFEKTADVKKLQKQLIRFAEIATGRGGLWKLEKIAPEVNAVFFAPKLISSRVQMLTWVFNKNLDPYVRKQHLMALSKLIGAGTAFLVGLHYATGAKVGLDPRNPDFGKARFGKTRIDLWGGHQPYVRVMAQILSGTAISSVTGKKAPLRGPGSKGPFSRNSLGILKTFTEGKLAPPAGFVDAWLNNSDGHGGTFSAKKYIRDHVWPLVAQDAVSVANDTNSPLWGVGAYAIGGLGVGIQNYGAPGGPAGPPVNAPSGGGGFVPSGGNDPFSNWGGGGGQSFTPTPSGNDPFSNWGR